MTAQTKIQGIDDILSRLRKVKRIGTDEYEALCPAHDDKVPSLHIKQDKNKILLSCKAGCTNESITKALGLTMANLFLDHSPALDRKIVATYPYHDADGRVIYEVIRFEPKGFSQRRHDGRGGYIWNLNSVKPVLYHLPDVIKAVVHGDTIYIAEGEKDCDSLWGLGLVATTNPGGAGKWKAEYSDILTGASVVIIPDNDEGGRKHAEQVALATYGKAKSLKLVSLQGAKDVTEWMELEGTIEYLQELVEKEPKYIPSPEVDSGTLSKPIVSSVADAYELLWKPEGIRIDVRNFRQERNGNITAEFDTDNIAGGSDLLTPVTGLRYNLNTPLARKHFAEALEGSYIDASKSKNISWTNLANDTFMRVIGLYRKGKDVEEVWSSSGELTKPQYLLYPILPLGLPAIIFGDGGSGKSRIAILIAIITQLPYSENGLGLKTQAEPARALFLDYETSKAEFQRELSLLINGLGLGAMPVDYLRATTPIADMVETLHTLVREKGYKLIVIDSLAQASGGNINEPEPALKLYGALRRLESVTSLILAHNSKDPLTKVKTTFGSVFFTNYARSVWELKKQQEAGEDVLVCGLIHRKANMSKLHLPLGFRFSFTDNAVTVQRDNLQDTSLSENLPVYIQMRELLLTEGRMEKEKIAQALEKPVKQVKAILYKYKDIFINLDGGKVWGVISDRESY